MINENQNKQLTKIIDRSIDLFLNSQQMLVVDGDFFNDRLFQSQKGIFLEIGTDDETIISLGNLNAENNFLENLTYVLFNILNSLDKDSINKIKNKEYHRRLWVVDSYQTINQLDQANFFDTLIIKKPGIIINYEKENSFCWLPKIWDTVYDPVNVLEKLSENANLSPESWKDPENQIIIFESSPTLI